MLKKLPCCHYADTLYVIWCKWWFAMTCWAVSLRIRNGVRYGRIYYISIHQEYKYHRSIRSCLPFLSFLRCRGVNSTTPVKHHPLPFNSPDTLAALIELSETHPGQICEQPHAGEVFTESSQTIIHIHIQMSQPSNDSFSAIQCLAMSSNHISVST